MEWYWWVLIWGLSGAIALAMDMRDYPAMRENLGWAEVWPVIFAPGWLLVKLWQWYVVKTYP